MSVEDCVMALMGNEEQSGTAVSSGTGLVFLFPGQSSAGPAALARARQVHPVAEGIAARAARILGNARAAAWLAPGGARLATNRDVQVVVFLATQMYLAALTAEGIDAECSLGLSLGEYSHLVHIGALDFDDALRLVDERGRCFDEAPPGMMVTVLAVDGETVADVVDRARVLGPVVVSNYNSSTQHVISGSARAVAWAAETLEDEQCALTTVIERRVPMHSPLMSGVARAFSPALEQARWRAPRADYWPNVTALPLARAARADLVAHLTRHVSEPVRWQSSLDAVLTRHPGAMLVEVGPGGVLANMVGRSWRSARCARIDGPDGTDPRQHFAATIEALRA